MAKVVRTFCVAHKPVAVPLPEDVPVIWSGAAPIETNGHHRVWRVGDLAPELEIWSPFLANSAGSFAINSILRQRLVEWLPGELISVVQYRRFMAAKPIGVEAANHPGMYLPSEKDLENFDLHEIQNDVEGRWRISQPLNLIGGVYGNYVRFHNIVDLLKYTTIAVELGVISPQESLEFLADPLLVPGGLEFGIYPIEFFMDIMEKLRAICITFLTKYAPVAFDGYQRRALAFCNERLGSHIMLRELRREFGGEIPQHVFGYMHAIVESGQYTVGIG